MITELLKNNSDLQLKAEDGLRFTYKNKFEVEAHTNEKCISIIFIGKDISFDRKWRFIDYSNEDALYSDILYFIKDCEKKLKK